MDVLAKLKSTYSGTFYKDLSRFEPGKQGIALGEGVRIRVEGEGCVVTFLAGTPQSTRKLHLDRLQFSGLGVSEGGDFRS